jgi:hypothetical protein
MMMMVPCNNAMSMLVDEDTSSGAAASVISSCRSHMPMVCCNAMAWTDETKEETAEVLVTLSDPVTGAPLTTAEQSMPRTAPTGTPTEPERRYMERKWWERLWQAMPRVHKRKSRALARAVERAAMRQDERQTEVLLAKARDWNAHVFYPKSVE